jgi:hypothetical protein
MEAPHERNVDVVLEIGRQYSQTISLFEALQEIA